MEGSKSKRKIATPVIVIAACTLLFLSRYVVMYTEQRYGWLSDMNPSMLVALFTYYIAQPLAVLVLAIYATRIILRRRGRRSNLMRASGS